MKKVTESGLRGVEQSYICPVCYCNYENGIEINAVEVHINNTETKICDYCKTHPNLTKKELIDRRVDVLEKTQVEHFAPLIKEIWEYIKRGKD